MELKTQRTGFRQFIPPQDSERSQQLATLDTYEWAKRRCAESFVAGWTQHWEELAHEPYKGITTDGTVIPGLFPLRASTSAAVQGGVPTVAMAAAARRLLEAATPDERARLVLPLDAVEWRYWANPEIYIYRHGVRLEEVGDEVVDAVHGVLRASLSSAGYDKVRGCMKVNRFLGEVVNGRKVLNERSYNFCLFGDVDEIEVSGAPWGWQIFGHHFCMNCLVVEGQMVVTPVFMGAEPNVIDEGPDRGLELFTDQEHLAMGLMRSLDDETVKKLRIFKELKGPEYPTWRYHRADQRHLGGAFQDNRIIPYEGARVIILTAKQQELIRGLLTLSLNYLPDAVLAAKMAEVAVHWNDTYFAYIGGWGEQDAFYYKVHSPVVMVEFDHHSGVFLNNRDALPFHIHTIVRTPNGNDYGKQLLRQYSQRLKVTNGVVIGHER